MAALAMNVNPIVTCSFKVNFPPDVLNKIAKNLTVNETKTMHTAVLICEPLI